MSNTNKEGKYSMGFLDFIKNIFNTNDKYARLITQDLHKIQGGKEQLEIGLYLDETPLPDKNINIKINGVTYVRKTDNDGIARLNINLGVGVYDALISFVDTGYAYTSSYATVYVNPVIESYDLNMRQGDGSKYIAVLSGIKQNKIPNAKLCFNINGMNYERTTDENGLASLNINLNKGDYEITTTSYETVKKNQIHIDEEPPKSTRMEGTDINKTYGEDTPYQCAVYSNDERVAGTVNITVNGVTYKKTPDSEGLYKLNINLQPGSYILRAEFQGNNKYASSSVENKINIKEQPKPQPKSYSQQILEAFEAKFGSVSTIDGALAKVCDWGYAYYYDDRYSNLESINRIYRGLGINCTDACHLFWHIGKALGYDVRCIHVGCRGGDGHVRLQFRHPSRTGGAWINRDPAAVLSANGQGVIYCWCLDGTTWAIDPSWFLENLYR